MPDPVITPSAPAGGGSAAPPAAIPTGGGNADAVREIPAQGGGADQGISQEGPDKFEFSFDGDPEKYSFEEKQEGAEAEQGYDASKPFDAKIEELLKASPDLLKVVKQGHYELRQWKGTGFKTPAEVKAYKDRIDALGGAETVETDLKEGMANLEAAKSGDYAKLRELISDGKIKLAGPFLDDLKNEHPGVWANYMAKTFMATLLRPNEQGLSSLAAFNQLYDAVKDNPQAKKLLDQIAGTINDVNKAAQNAPAETSNQPDKGRDQLNVERHTVYLQGLNNKTAPIIDAAARQALMIAFKGRKLSAEVQKEFLEDIKKGFNSLQKQDAVFQQNAKDLLTKQDSDRFLRVLKSAIARNMPRAALREARKYKGLSGDSATRRAEGQARTESAPGGGQTPNRMKYSGPMKQGGPDPSMIDYAAMRGQFGRKGADEMLGRREFYKKGEGGKTIYFW